MADANGIAGTREIVAKTFARAHSIASPPLGSPRPMSQVDLSRFRVDPGPIWARLVVYLGSRVESGSPRSNHSRWVVPRLGPSRARIPWFADELGPC